MSCRQSFRFNQRPKPSKEGKNLRASPSGPICREYYPQVPCKWKFWVLCGNEERQAGRQKNDPAPSSRNANQAGRNTNAGILATSRSRREVPCAVNGWGKNCYFFSKGPIRRIAVDHARAFPRAFWGVGGASAYV